MGHRERFLSSDRFFPNESTPKKPILTLPEASEAIFEQFFFPKFSENFPKIFLKFPFKGSLYGLERKEPPSKMPIHQPITSGGQ